MVSVKFFHQRGASIITFHMFKDFCSRWGIQQRISSAYHAHSNKRAEVAVKKAKRLVNDSLGPGGSLDTDALARALLAHRNTPDPLTGLSPAQVIFGRMLRDFNPCSPGKYEPRAEWRLVAEDREIALAKRHVKMAEQLSKGTKQLPPLQEGDCVVIQDQTGNTPKRWSKTGKILEALGYDSYLVKVDGSNRLTKRNRQFLRCYKPFQVDNDSPTLLPNASMPAYNPADTLSNQLPDFKDPADVDADKANTTEANLPSPVAGPISKNPLNSNQPSDPPFHPREVDNGVSRTSGGGEEGAYHDSRQMPDNLKMKLFKTPSGWSTSPNSQDTKIGGPVDAAQPGVQSQFQQGPQFTPPPPGTPHYEMLRRLEAESRRQVEASKQLNAYLAFMMTNQAMSSSAVGGIQGYYAQLPHLQSYDNHFVF